MVIGVSVWQLQIPGCASLKEKRSVIKGLKQRLHNEFNISVAETAHHDVLQRSELAACVVATDQPQANRVLGAEIPLDCPVRLLHGQDDGDVPPEISLRLARSLRSQDVQVTLIKGGDHRLSRESDIALLLRTVAALT